MNSPRRGSEGRTPPLRGQRLLLPWMAADDGARRWMGGQAWLQAELFRIVFRCVSLNLFGDGECGSWPQQQIGVVLWSLSTTRHRWQNTFKLIKLSVLPDEAVLRTPEFVAPTLFVWRVLCPASLVRPARVPARPHLRVSGVLAQARPVRPFPAVRRARRQDRGLGALRGRPTPEAKPSARRSAGAA